MSTRKALVVQGGWDGHWPARGAALLRELLEAEGFKVEVIDALDRLAEPHGLAGIDLLVPHWTMGELPKGAAKVISEAVVAGCGIAGFHGGMGDAFRKETEFQFITGGQFVAHPGGVKPYRVRIRDHGHPITAGLEDFELVSEQYYVHVDPSNHVLADTVFDGVGAAWTLGVVMPVAWVRHHGAGRVFYCSPGHRPEDLEVPAARTLLRRGLAWAAR